MWQTGDEARLLGLLMEGEHLLVGRLVGGKGVFSLCVEWACLPGACLPGALVAGEEQEEGTVGRYEVGPCL